MDQRWMLPLLCAAVVWFVGSIDGRGVRGEEVLELTPETFEQEVGLDKGALVEFYAPSCGQCEKLAPEYESLAGFFKLKRNVLIAKVDCGEHKSLCLRYGIKEIPTIKWFPKGSLEPTAKVYGDPTAVELAQFVNKVSRSMPASTFGSALALLLVLYYYLIK